MTTFTKNRGGRGGSSRESHGHQELSRVNKVATAQFGGHSLGIYIQVPFCQTKCTYCNFHTGVASPSAYAPYARAVEREIRNWRALHAGAGLPSPESLSRAVIPNPGRILDGGEVRCRDSGGVHRTPETGGSAF